MCARAVGGGIIEPARRAFASGGDCVNHVGRCEKMSVRVCVLCVYCNDGRPKLRRGGHTINMNLNDISRPLHRTFCRTRSMVYANSENIMGHDFYVL